MLHREKLKGFVSRLSAVPAYNLTIRPAAKAHDVAETQPEEALEKKPHEEIANIDVEELGARIARGEGDPRLLKICSGLTDENNPATWIADEDIWEKAKDAVKPYWDRYDEPYAVVTHTYKAMGGRIGV